MNSIKFLQEMARYQRELAKLQEEHAKNLDAIAAEEETPTAEKPGSEYDARRLKAALSRVAALAGDHSFAGLCR